MKKSDANLLISAYCKTDNMGRPLNRIKAILIDTGRLEIIPTTPLYERFENGHLYPTYYAIEEYITATNDVIKHEKIFTLYATAVAYLVSVARFHEIKGVLVTGRDY